MNEQVEAYHYPKDLFIHLHIVKCGGTTFQDILAQNFTANKRSFLWEHHFLFHQYTQQQFGQLIDNAPFVEAYSSHHISLELPLDRTDKNIQVISYVRNPVDRFLSYYYMQHKAPQYSLQTAPMARFMNLDEYITYALEEGNVEEHVKKGQLWYMTTDTGNQGLEQVKKLVEDGKLDLFPLERFDESCLVLQKKFPESFKNIIYRNKNVSQKKEIATPAQRERIASFFSAQEFELHRFSQQLIVDQLAQFFSKETQQSALEQYRKACVQFALDKKKPQRKSMYERLRLLKKILLNEF